MSQTQNVGNIIALDLAAIIAGDVDVMAQIAEFLGEPAEGAEDAEGEATEEMTEEATEEETEEAAEDAE